MNTFTVILYICTTDTKSVILDLLCDLSDCSDRSETGDLVPQAIDKDGHALGQLGSERVTNGGHDLPHAGDGSLFHLLVYVSCFETLQG